MASKDPNEFAPYAPYLGTTLWPSLDVRTGAVDTVQVHRDEMPPQYAAAALAKLVRWARIAPQGDIVHYPDEDSREVAVRSSELGKSLAARAVNLDESTFFAMYGEFGLTPKIPRDMLGALLAVLLEEAGLDWGLRERVMLALTVADGVLEEFNVHDKRLR